MESRRDRTAASRVTMCKEQSVCLSTASEQQRVARPTRVASREFTLKNVLYLARIRDRSVDWDKRPLRERDTRLDHQGIGPHPHPHPHRRAGVIVRVGRQAGKKSDVDAYIYIYMYIYPTFIGHSSADSYCRQVAALRREITALAHTRPDSPTPVEAFSRSFARTVSNVSRNGRTTTNRITNRFARSTRQSRHTAHDTRYTRHTTDDIRNQSGGQT